MSISVFQENELPKIFIKKDIWDINDTPIAKKDEKFSFKRNPIIRNVNFSFLKDTMKKEMKYYLWTALEKECLKMSEKNFKDKFLHTFTSLLNVLEKREEESILKIEYKTFKKEIAENERQTRIFRQAQISLLQKQNFEKGRDVWDIFTTPMNKNGRLSKYENSESRVINLSVIQNENIKKELKEYIFEYLNTKYEDYNEQTNVNHILMFQTILRVFTKENIETILNIDGNEIEESILEDGKTNAKDYIDFFERMKSFLLNKENLDFFQRDLWDLNKLAISEDRVNKTRMRKVFVFSELENEENKELLKKYTKYLLLNTNYSVSTIAGKLSDLKKFLSLLGSSLLAEIKKGDSIFIIREVEKEKINQNIYISINSFLYYLAREEDIAKEIGKEFVLKEFINKREVKFKDRFVEKDIIKEILEKIEGSEEEYIETIIHILVFCGLRISEVCNLKIDCAYI